jgi:hypothetical protein
MRIPVVSKWLLLGLGCLSFAQALGAAHDGDVNIDGDVNVLDLLWGEQSLSGTRGLLPEQEAHGDVAPLVSGVPQPDGVFDLGDLPILSRIALGGLDFFVPGNQFNIGDSIGEGEAADGTIGEPHHEMVWSTGYDGGDVVNSFNERFAAIAAADYDENTATRDALFNHAISGAEMADFVAQAQAIVAAAAQAPSGHAEMIAVLLGANMERIASAGSSSTPSSGIPITRSCVMSWRSTASGDCLTRPVFPGASRRPGRRGLPHHAARRTVPGPEERGGRERGTGRRGDPAFRRLAGRGRPAGQGAVQQPPGGQAGLLRRGHRPGDGRLE